MRNDVLMSRLGRAIATALIALPFVALPARTSGAAPAVLAKRAPPSAARATESFGLDLMHRLGRGNLVFSPDSIAAALAMTGTGAVGDTADQIARALHLGPAANLPASGRLQQTIIADQAAVAHGSSEAPILNIANGLFVGQGLVLEAPFTTDLAQWFGASPQIVDFRTPGAIEAINAWANQQTHGLIPHILSELSPQTLLALANAIYLKATWSEKFDENETRPAPFRKEGRRSSAEFMHDTQSLPYAAGRGYAAVAIPYRDSTLSLLVVLPRRESLPRLERQLDARTLDRIVATLKPHDVRLSLPRFHLQVQTTLNAPLERLGIRDAFAEGAADFSGITQTAPLRISEVLHAADFKIDERGTEAAAVTLGLFRSLSAIRYRHVVDFNANHPFLFFLRDDHTGALLFAGRLVTPQD
jgi:serpin B